jgi:hypothetical protein
LTADLIAQNDLNNSNTFSVLLEWSLTGYNRQWPHPSVLAYRVEGLVTKRYEAVTEKGKLIVDTRSVSPGKYMDTDVKQRGSYTYVFFCMYTLHSFRFRPVLSLEKFEERIVSPLFVTHIDMTSLLRLDTSENRLISGH